MPGHKSSTKAVFLAEQDRKQHQTTITSLQTIASLPEQDRQLFKNAKDTDDILTTSETIFYPQGGGQPSDTGYMKSPPGAAEEGTFAVESVRYATSSGEILHCGHFEAPNPSTFHSDQPVTQEIDGERRELHSRIHSAGHILGLAVAELKIPDIDEGTRAMHFPESAFVDFKGLIDGKHKDAIQTKVDELVQQDIPIHVQFWAWPEAREKCNISPDEMGLDPSEPVRAVEVEGLGAYPCGGTHVHSTKGVGKINVRKITRSKGVSKISYNVSPG
ncbi:MAG: hypothetical protein Q9227_000718 [Pyrenula ochraceoflavens]